MVEELHLIEMASGGQIALTHLKNTQPAGLPLIVTHGTVSNGRTVKGLAQFLSEAGLDCWILEWGGHGDSQAASSRQNFEYPAFHDVPTAITAVLEKTDKSQLIWVSHSGGGHLPLMYLSHHPEQQNLLAGLVTLGAQATDGALKFHQKLSVAFLWVLTTLLNQTPISLIPIGNETEPTRLLAQWATWNIRERWLGEDGFDYLKGLAQIKIPTFMVAGGNDRIAPISGCLKLFNALGSEEKTWLTGTVESGFSKEFSHSQLVRGKAAKKELFPKILEWIKVQSEKENGSR